MMGRAEVERLAQFEDRLRGELMDAELAGLEDRANRVREEIAAVRAKLEEYRRARQAQESAEWDAKKVREREEEARARQREVESEEARVFLRALFEGGQPIEERKVEDAAREAGVSVADLLWAARELGVRRLGHLQPGTATLRDRSKPTFWGFHSPWSAMLDLGPATLGSDG